jgi:hypothetical protein
MKTFEHEFLTDIEVQASCESHREDSEKVSSGQV